MNEPEETNEEEAIEEYDDLMLLTDAHIMKALIAHQAIIQKTAKFLNCEPRSLYYRIKANPDLMDQVREELDVRLTLMADNAVSNLENSIKNGSVKASMMVLQKLGLIQEAAKKIAEANNRDIEALTSGNNESKAVSNWKKKLDEAPRDKDGKIIVDGEKH